MLNAKVKVSPDAAQWEADFHNKTQSLKDKKIFSLILLSEVPSSTKIQKGHSMFTWKKNELGETICFKVCFVFKGFKQIYSKDYTSTTSPTAFKELWRILLHIAAMLR